MGGILRVKRYFVNEIFYSLQGEGVRAGCPSTFLRFGKCNLACKVETHGFDCDTEFASGKLMTLDEVVAGVGEPEWIVCTGGEPGLQLDTALIDALHDAGHLLAIETNGSIGLPDGLDWITVSPKVAEHAIRQTTATEVKYVRSWGQEIPRTVVHAQHHLISPAFGPDGVDRRTLKWCIDLVKDNPPWRLSVQQHKQWSVR